ncbi:MAG: protein kinase [Myxococcaceae bacterium]|nr:protein kinase [Myxococcaceae bacterium]
MQEDYEAELRMALAEGLVSREEAAALGEEARRLGRTPLELLKERGQLSDASLAALKQADLESTLKPGSKLDGAATLGPALTLKDRDKVDPPFPIPGWDRYQGVRFLGQGGMGQVFLAYDLRLRRNVALKFVRGDDAELVRRLLSEARAQARVEHERVCQVHEVGEVQGRPYIAMQFVDGLPSGQLAGELTVEQKALVLRDAAEGVHAAHRAGLIHRDLKPSNILVERTDDGRLKPFVMDFGLAHDWSEKGATATGSVLGTPHYMAPEQARGEVERLDRRADVYSLGATLYFLLTGEPPIPGANGLEVLNNIATVEPRPPRAVDPNIPSDLEAIVLKCLEKDRSARYDSARALIEDLDRFLAGEPVQARPTGLWYRLRKKARKHRLVVAVAAVASLAVLLALGWALYTHSQATRREELTRRFTEKVEHIEALTRFSGLSPLHDTRDDQKEIRAHMAELERWIREAGGPLAEGPGNYALARGHLALRDEDKARKHLEAAWESGFHDPRVAYALALVLGHLYQDQLLEVETLPSEPEREARKQALQRRLRDPALDWLRRSKGAEVHSTEYVAALIAFYEERFDEALARLDALGNRLPWFYEAPQLRGDIFRMRAARRWNQGELEGAQADLDAGRRAYEAAAAIGESVPATYQSLAKLEYTAVVIGLYSTGDVLPSFTRGTQAVARSLQASPDDGATLMLEARLHRRLAEYHMGQLGRGEDPQAALEAALAAASKALQHGHPARDVYPEQGRILYSWARFLMTRGQDPRERLRQAEQAIQAISADARDYEFHSALGLILSTWAEYEDRIGASSAEHRQRAIESLQAATRLNPLLPDAWINLGRTYIHRTESASLGSPAEQRLRQEQDLKSAWEALQRALDINPRHYVPYIYGGRVHAQRARLHWCDEGAAPLLATALELYRKGRDINPKRPYFNNDIGKVLLAQAEQTWDHGGDPFPLLDEAQRSFEEVIRAAPQQPYGYNSLGMTHLWRATYRRAQREDMSVDARATVSAFEQAIQRAPDDPFFVTDLGDIFSLLAEASLEQGADPSLYLQRAESALRAALARNAQQPRSWLLLGRTLGVHARWRARTGTAREEDFEQAAQAFERALELEPAPRETPLVFGSLLHEWALWKKEAGRAPAPQLERGLALVEETLSNCSDSPSALLLRAKLRMIQASTEARADAQQAWRRRAREDLSRALAKNPHLASVWKE